DRTEDGVARDERGERRVAAVVDDAAAGDVVDGVAGDGGAGIAGDLDAAGGEDRDVVDRVAGDDRVVVAGSDEDGAVTRVDNLGVADRDAVAVGAVIKADGDVAADHGEAIEGDVVRAGEVEEEVGAGGRAAVEDRRA